MINYILGPIKRLPQTVSQARKEIPMMFSGLSKLQKMSNEFDASLFDLRFQQSKNLETHKIVAIELNRELSIADKGVKSSGCSDPNVLKRIQKLKKEANEASDFAYKYGREMARKNSELNQEYKKRYLNGSLEEITFGKSDDISSFFHPELYLMPSDYQQTALASLIRGTMNHTPIALAAADLIKDPILRDESKSWIAVHHCLDKGNILQAKEIAKTIQNGELKRKLECDIERVIQDIPIYRF
jgi:hypothetical protein